MSNEPLPSFPVRKLQADVCVVGGGIGGLCAALAAARHGARAVLVQDRPVLGGNASSEIRMHICGAHGDNRRETGIVEELFLDNLRWNPSAAWPVFDSVLWGKAAHQPGLETVLDASVCSAERAEDGSLRSVRAWQTTTETWIDVEAKFFVDASGDAVLAPLSGADFRQGREARSEYGESEAPPEGDSHTMGNSILLQAAEFPEEQPFVPFPWAHDYSAPENREWLKGRWCDFTQNNLWWIEVGGMGDCVRDAEKHREELLKIVYGVWDYVKNHAEPALREKAKNFGLVWVGSLPGKRESRRYLGPHVLTQGEVQAGGVFPDVVAYGGWKIDNHYPEGFYHVGDGTKYTDCPSPFGIPFRSLFSRNVPNLFCAGRDISATHVALSATRVMATCGLEGQAVGTAAALCVHGRFDPRDLAADPARVAELQRQLMDDDCFLPGLLREVRGPCASAKLAATGGEGVERLRDGMERDWDDGSHAWRAPLGAAAEYRFLDEEELHEARVVLDSDLNRRDSGRPYGETDRLLQGRYYRALHDPLYAPPPPLLRAFRIDRLDEDGVWRREAEVEDNHQRLVRVPLDCRARGLRLVPLATWGAPDARVFAFDAK